MRKSSVRFTSDGRSSVCFALLAARSVGRSVGRLTAGCAGRFEATSRIFPEAIASILPRFTTRRMYVYFVPFPFFTIFSQSHCVADRSSSLC